METKQPSNYFWIRVYEYDYERDKGEKGTMLDEFYLKDVEGGREGAKTVVQERYCGKTANELKFSKPRKNDGIYAIVMDSNLFFYERFYVMVDTYCFLCHQPIKGKASEFPRERIEEHHWREQIGEKNVAETIKEELNQSEFDPEQTAYFCCYEHKREFNSIKYGYDHEGEFQEKEEGKNGQVYGYIYLIYNRAEDTYYIGQTRYMPFFRWQEHIKDGAKGDITDMSFSVLAEIHKTFTNEKDQLYLNSVESFWINKYKAEGHKVFNISKPKITVAELKERFRDMVEKQESLLL